MSDFLISTHENKQKKRIDIKPFKQIKESLPTEEQQDNIKQDIEAKQLELKSLEQQREKMLQDIKTTIKHEKEEWKEKKQRLIEQAEKDGYQAGFTVGEQKGIQQYGSLIMEANDIIKLATKDYHETVGKSEEKIIELSAHMAEKVIQQELNQNPNVLMNIVKAAIKDIKEQPIIAIYIHPSNYQILLQQKKELETVVDGDSKVAIYIDQDLSNRDCRIEHPFGQIDAGIKTQLGQIHRILHDIVMESKQ